MQPASQTPAPRRLVVIRHAQAEQQGPTDFDRPLAAQGHRDARAAGEWLAGQSFTLDAALVSAALRTRETWQSLCSASGYAEELAELDRGLYHAGCDSALDLIRLTSDEVGSLAVVGHNPTVEMLVHTLDDGTGVLDPSSGYPTAAMTVLEFEGSWADLAGQRARATGFHVARG